MENYNNEDAFINIVNKRNEDVKKLNVDAMTTNMIVSSDVTKIYNQLKGEAFEQKLVAEDRKRIQKNMLIRKWIVAGTLVGTLVAGITVNAVFGKDIAQQNEKNKIISTALDKECSYAREQMLRKDLATMVPSKAVPFTVLDNSSFDYRELDVDGLVDIYVYKTILPKDEFTKFIKSVYYTNEEGNHYYSDYEDFLNVNNFESESDFEKAAREILYEMVSNKSKGGK